MRQAKSRSLTLVRRFLIIVENFDRRRQQAEHRNENAAKSRVNHHHYAVTVRRRNPSTESLGNYAARESAQGSRERARERIPCEDLSAPGARHDMREGGLFDGRKRAHFVAAWADHADGRR